MKTSHAVSPQKKTTSPRRRRSSSKAAQKIALGQLSCFSLAATLSAATFNPASRRLVE